MTLDPDARAILETIRDLGEETLVDCYGMRRADADENEFDRAVFDCQRRFERLDLGAVASVRKADNRRNAAVTFLKLFGGQ